MEQLFNSYSTSFRNAKLLFVFALLVFLVGCKKELPNPETLDPIYKDLSSETKKLKKDLKETTEKLESLLAEKSKIAPRSLEVKINMRDTKKARVALLKIKQKLKYLEIRTERRRVEARKAYRIAFKEGKTWPDPNEYKNYSTHKRLRNAPKNWNYRVPKLHARNPNFKEKSKK